MTSAASSCPAIVISGAGSNQGKTIVAAALARYLKNCGKKVVAFKVGPDFLDPMILEYATGEKVYQLDSFMLDWDEIRNHLFKASQRFDFIIVEGLMGLYDGPSSTAELARHLKIPVIAVINAQGMSETFHAIAHGLKSYCDDINFLGTFANKVGSQRHAATLASYAKSAESFFGSLLRNEAAEIPSRHLGLALAEELVGLDKSLNLLADCVGETKLAHLDTPCQFYPAPVQPQPQLLKDCRIAIAKDAAFCFIYQANLDILEALGAKLSYFSPLQDMTIPAADAIYLPGGYPELHLNQLVSNSAMKTELANWFYEGKPIYAECGGMMYLMKSLTDVHGVKHEMSGLIDGHSYMRKKLSALAYQQLSLDGEIMRGHTFHYSESEISEAPYCRATHPLSGSDGEWFFKIKSLWCSYLHLYFPSNAKMTASFFLLN